MSSKARGTLQVRSSQGSGDGRIILDNSGWLIVITRVLMRGGRRGELSVSEKEGWGGKNRPEGCVPQAKEHRWPLSWKRQGIHSPQEPP